ncbi:hypothetical protein [Sporisorium scitamineum]|uniref:Uncharacterized protein n=1 Tax=Sporisorium scitamineum TaxID=49012 RepID=A0A0F7SD39_9BASI|nr:hypothetical protein [Sporisorium scitamineum]
MAEGFNHCKGFQEPNVLFAVLFGDLSGEGCHCVMGEAKVCTIAVWTSIGPDVCNNEWQRYQDAGARPRLKYGDPPAELRQGWVRDAALANSLDALHIKDISSPTVQQHATLGKDVQVAFGGNTDCLLGGINVNAKYLKAHEVGKGLFGTTPNVSSK